VKATKIVLNSNDSGVLSRARWDESGLPAFAAARLTLGIGIACRKKHK